MANLTQLFLAANGPRLSNAIGKLIHAMYSWIGNFGWMVVVFTIFLKLILSPLDIWQKRTMQKNNRAMKVIAPELEKLKKTYANAPDVLQQKQMELYKKNGYSMTGGCLPAIVTIVIFFVVFSGFNAAVRYENEMIVYDLANEYNAIVEANPDIDSVTLNEKMVAAYDARKQSWLWVDNVFMADTGTNQVPTAERFTGSGLGYINAKMPKNLPSTFGNYSDYDNGYDAVMGPAKDKYNTRSTFDVARWNGYFILPLLSILLSVFSMKITKSMQPEMPTQTDENGNPVKNKQGMMKIMNWMMPALMGVFAVFYSAAFCIYMFMNSLITVLFNVIYNVIAKRLDAKAEDRRLSRTFK